MSQNIQETRLVPISIQSGSGVPTHLSPIGTLYFDSVSGNQFINKDGLVHWAYFHDTDKFGNVDVFVSGGTYSASTLTFTNTTGGTFNISGITSGGGSTFTGGTITGATTFTGGLTANVFSATTYQNLPSDVFVTGGTYSNGTSIFTNNTGGTFSVTGLTTPFTGGTVTGSTSFTGGLSATTVSGGTYYSGGTTLKSAILNNTGVSGGTYGSATQIPVLTIQADGRVLSASTVVMATPAGASLYLFYNY